MGVKWYLIVGQHLSVFFISAILLGVKWYLMILIFISLIICDAEHLFVYLLTICISSVEKCLFKSFALFSTGLLVFLLLCCNSSLYILFKIISTLLLKHRNWGEPGEFFIYSEDKFLIWYMLCKYFLLFHGFSFHLLDGVLWSTNVFNFDEDQFILLLFFLMCYI